MCLARAASRGPKVNAPHLPCVRGAQRAVDQAAPTHAGFTRQGSFQTPGPCVGKQAVSPPQVKCVRSWTETCEPNLVKS